MPVENCVGTLVLAFQGLSCAKGGNLRVGQLRFDSSQSVAFYPDVPHSVELVEEGYRVSASFSIMKGEGWDSTTPTTYQEAIRSKQSVLQGALQQLLERHPKFGVLLEHRYSVHETDGKGADQPLLAELRKLADEGVLGYEIHNAILSHSEESWKYIEMVSDEGERTEFVFRCDLDDWNYLLGHTGTSTKPNPPEKMPVYHCGAKYGRKIHGHQQLGSENVGNNAEPEILHNVYFSRVALVHGKAKKLRKE